MSTSPIKYSQTIQALDLSGIEEEKSHDQIAVSHLDLAIPKRPLDGTSSVGYNFENFTTHQSLYNFVCSHLDFFDLFRLMLSSKRCKTIVEKYNPRGRLEKICSFVERHGLISKTTIRKIIVFNPKSFLECLWKSHSETDLFSLSNAVSKIENRNCHELMSRLANKCMKQVRKMVADQNRLVTHGIGCPDYYTSIPEQLAVKAKIKPTVNNSVIESRYLDFIYSTTCDKSDVESSRFKNDIAIILGVLKFKLAKLSPEDLVLLENFSEQMISDLEPLFNICVSYNAEGVKLLVEKAERDEEALIAPAVAFPAPVGPPIPVQTNPSYWKYGTAICVCIVAVIFFRSRFML